jgi:hypothetical protein
MYSLKPGRGPSAMGAVGSLVAVIFGIFWTIMAYQITRNSPWPIVGIMFPAFGLLFICIGIGQFIFNAYNASQRNRMSLMDVTHADEEPDPLNQRFQSRPQSDEPSAGFCSKCGVSLSAGDEFCRKCGTKVRN